MAVGADQDYEAEPLICHACATRDQTAESFRKANGDTKSIHWMIRRRKELG